MAGLQRGTLLILGASRNTLTLVIWCGVAASLCLGCSRPPESAPARPSPVQVEPVRRDNVAVEMTLVGTVVPLDVSRVASGASGNVLQFPFREGALIEKGQTLAQLRNVTLGIEIEAAKAQLREKQQRYEELKTGYRKEEIAQADAQVKGAQALLKFSKAQLERLQQLTQQSAISKEELDEAISQASQAEQAMIEAKANYKMKSEGYRSEHIEQAKAALDAQRQEVLRLEDEMTKRTITAPFTGYLVEKHTDVGEWVEEGGLVGTLVNLEEVEVVVNVEEQYVGMLRVGSSIDVHFSFLPPDQQTIQATIEKIVPRSNWQAGSRSFPLRLRVKNRLADGQPVLKEGMLASVTLRGQPHEALLVHKDSVVRKHGDPTVFIVGDDNRVEPLTINEGIHSGKYIEAIDADLTPGQLLVTEGVERLRPFEEVMIMDLTAPVDGITIRHDAE